jgi:hypothetical protein
MKEMKLLHAYDLGGQVLCDMCNGDYSDSASQGGILFQSKAVCPECSPKLLRNAEKYDEMHMIRDRAREGESFRDFTLRIRGGNNTVRIYGGEP